MNPLIMRLSVLLGLFSAGSRANPISAPKLSNVTYEVPVEKEFEPFAKFVLTDFKRTITPAGVEFSYSLPPELTGIKDSELTFTVLPAEVVDGKNFSLVGDHGQANCVFKSFEQVECQVTFKNLVINAAAIDGIVREKTNDTKEIKSRLAVAKLFSSEPVGIIRYQVGR